MEAALSILVGIGLAAACGFRVFIPPLVMSIAAMAGHLKLAPGFEWIGTWPALLAFATATLFEVIAYYVPWLDNLLDAAATPAAIVAGVLVTASVVQAMSPWLRWSLAVIAGGAAAGTVQLLTVKARALSSLFTLGTANAGVSTAEAGGAVMTSLLVLLFPILAAAVLVASGLSVWLLLRRRR